MTAHHTTLTARATRAATVTTLTALAVLTGLIDRAGGRRSDKGSTLETVIIWAGVCALAIAAVAWIGPVVMRYLSQIV